MGRLLTPRRRATSRRFANDGETRFDALASSPIDWDGRTAGTACSACDLSGRVLEDLGYFASRDALLAANGQTLCGPARTIGNAVFSRRVVASYDRGAPPAALVDSEP